MSAAQSPSIISSTHKERESTVSVVSPTPLKEKIAELKGGDAALAILAESPDREPISPKDDRRVLRKIDLWIMPVVLLVYFTQQLD
ncbi:hypothetical protein H0H92_001332, partial [Tricholoma furcatifolium]